MGRSIIPRFFSTSGRIGRKRYWQKSAPFLALAIACIAAFIFAPPAFRPYTVGLGGIVLVLHAQVAIRRLHDRGKSSYWLLLYYYLPVLFAAMTRFEQIDVFAIPLAAAAIVLPLAGIYELGTLKGEDERNEWGKPPRER